MHILAYRSTHTSREREEGSREREHRQNTGDKKKALSWICVRKKKKQ
jgi:hypothetical protein